MAWASSFGFQLLWAGPKPLLGHYQWPGLAWLMALGQARHITIPWMRVERTKDLCWLAFELCLPSSSYKIRPSVQKSLADAGHVWVIQWWPCQVQTHSKESGRESMRFNTERELHCLSQTIYSHCPGGSPLWGRWWHAWLRSRQKQACCRMGGYKYQCKHSIWSKGGMHNQAHR